jgi:hypothetical protein
MTRLRTGKKPNIKSQSIGPRGQFFILFVPAVRHMPSCETSSSSANPRPPPSLCAVFPVARPVRRRSLWI